nr:hypothetical protein GCM10020185_82060 [Pseudomonas brassicacearum subsp. brassicacearum]
MAGLGLTLKFSDAHKGWAGWIAEHSPRPIFVIGKPFDGKVHQPGNGQMVALLAPQPGSGEEQLRDSAGTGRDV